MPIAGNRFQRIIGALSGGRRRVSELIGRYVIATAQATLYKFRSYSKTVDATIPDYEFYDKLRRGKVTGYTISGLFVPAIANKYATWVFGDGFTVTLRDDDGEQQGNEDNEPQGDDAVNHTNQRLADFVAGILDSGMDDDAQRQDYDDESQALAMAAYRDALGLGDQYIVVNLDGTLSVPSPDTVTVERDEYDYHQVLAVRIETRVLNGQTVVDRYTASERIITIKRGAQVVSETIFQNLIGRIPVVHVSHGRSGNETNGHPIAEDLLPVLSEYDDLAYKQVDGAKLLGNPIPIFAGLEDINATIKANAPATTETYTATDGSTAEREQVNLDSSSVFFLGKGGMASMLAPPVGFTKDTSTGLRTLFFMLLARTGIPEFIWGGELTSARSTSETQLKQWVKDTQGRQSDNGGWIVKLCSIWLQVQALMDPLIILGALDLGWPDLVPEEEGLTLKRLTFALDNSLIRRATALELLHLVDDAALEAELAQGEADDRREAAFPGETFFQNSIEDDGDEDDDNEEDD